MIAVYYKYISECLGTMFICFLLLSVTNPIPIGLGYMLIKYALFNISGAHINPIYSLAMVLNKTLSIQDFFPYVVSQALGGVLAFELYKYFNL